MAEKLTDAQVLEAFKFMYPHALAIVERMAAGLGFPPEHIAPATMNTVGGLLTEFTPREMQVVETQLSELSTEEADKLFASMCAERTMRSQHHDK